MKSPYDIIIKPVLTEKSYSLVEERKYTFIVAKDCNKLEIREAVEKAFGVKVESVHTINRKGKFKRMGYTGGFRPDTKKAVVKLTEDSKAIEAFQGMA